MSDLFPTKTRLALLRDVAARRVTRNYFADGERDIDHNDRTVTGRLAEMERAGWVCLSEKFWTVANVFDGGHWEVRYWRITGAGRAVLDTHGSQP